MTRRQKIESILERGHGLSPSTVSLMLREHDIQLSPSEVLDDIEHIKESRTVKAAPPQCQNCLFDNFDNRLNIPSQCPACRSEWISEPRFTIEQ